MWGRSRRIGPYGAIDAAVHQEVGEVRIVAWGLAAQPDLSPQSSRVLNRLRDECPHPLVAFVLMRTGGFHHVVVTRGSSVVGPTSGRAVRRGHTGPTRPRRHFPVRWSARLSLRPGHASRASGRRTVGTIAFGGQARLRLRLRASPGRGARWVFVTSPIRQPGVRAEALVPTCGPIAHGGPTRARRRSAALYQQIWSTGSSGSTRISFFTLVIPGALAAARSAVSRCCHVVTDPEIVATPPETSIAT